MRKWEDLASKPKGEEELGRPECKWKYNIKMGLQEVGRECVKLLPLAECSKYPLTDGCEYGNYILASVGVKFLYQPSDY